MNAGTTVLLPSQTPTCHEIETGDVLGISADGGHLSVLTLQSSSETLGQDLPS